MKKLNYFDYPRITMIGFPKYSFIGNSVVVTIAFVHILISIDMFCT